MNRPKFTEEQENWLCEIIGDWYLSWKKRIANGEHRLGYAKEELKELICGNELHSIGINGMVYGFIKPQEFLTNYASWECAVCKKLREDKFIGVIKHDISKESGCDKEGYVTVNIKYCNDNDDCIAKAINKMNWIDK